MWNWYEWKSLEAFNAWHEGIKVKLNIPDEQTENYTGVVKVDEVWVGVVEESEAEGLIPTVIRPPLPK